MGIPDNQGADTQHAEKRLDANGRHKRTDRDEPTDQLHNDLERLEEATVESLDVTLVGLQDDADRCHVVVVVDRGFQNQRKHFVVHVLT